MASRRLKQYWGRIRRVESAGYEPDAGGFVAFLGDKKTKISHSTATQIYSAIKLYQVLQGWMPLSIEMKLVGMALTTYNAIQLDTRPPSVVYGSLGLDRITFIRDLPRDRRVRYFPDPWNHAGVIWQYTFALRCAEVGRITRGSVTQDGERYVLTIRRAKHTRHSNRNQYSDLEHHVGSTHFNSDIARVLALRPEAEGTLLFPDWSRTAVNGALRRIARDEKWDASYRWTSHAIRYGSAADARAEARLELQDKGGNVFNAVLERVKQRTGHMDHSMSFWYSMDASGRAQERARAHQRHQKRVQNDAQVARAALEELPPAIPRRRAREPPTLFANPTRAATGLGAIEPERAKRRGRASTNSSDTDGSDSSAEPVG